jgi:hypothetical protein
MISSLVMGVPQRVEMKKHVHAPGTFEDCPFTPEDIAIAMQVNLELGRERARKASLIKPPGSVKTPRPVAKRSPSWRRSRPTDGKNG